MSSGTPSENASVAGIHVRQARDVTLRAGGDIVAGDKTTIHNYYGPQPQDITKAPYKFLSYYDIGDRDIFFGRDAVVEELAGEIPRHKALIINGQSGSGKTSLINAGLIPRLAENGYLYVYFRDYTNPLEQLREYFRDHEDFALPGADKLSLLQILRTIRRQQESPVVVIFDQFERFLINVAAEPRREFLQQLRECLESDLTARQRLKADIVPQCELQKHDYAISITTAAVVDELTGRLGQSIYEFVDTGAAFVRGELIVVDTTHKLQAVGIDPGTTVELVEDSNVGGPRVTCCGPAFVASTQSTDLGSDCSVVCNEQTFSDDTQLSTVLLSYAAFENNSPGVAQFLDMAHLNFQLEVDPPQQFESTCDNLLGGSIPTALDSQLESNQLNLLISLRDDFYGKLLLEAEAIIPTFGTDSHHKNLRALNHDEARQAIKQPLKNIPNIGFDGKFVDRVLLPHLMRAGKTDGQSVVPESKIEPSHLQIVCNQLYEAARDRYRQQLQDGEPIRIGFDLYHDLGETEGMLRGYLDDVVRRITNGDPKQIAIVRSILKSMIETSGTRRFNSLDDTASNLPDVPYDEIARIIDRLREARIIEAKQVDDVTMYSLSSEIMVAKVESWFDEREMLRRRAQETLERGLAEWKSTKALLSETQVQNIRRWLPDKQLKQTEGGERLLVDSESEIEEQKRRAAEQQQTLDLARKRTKTARVIAAVVAAILIPASIAFGIWATINANRAETEAATARKNEKEAKSAKSTAEAAKSDAERQRISANRQLSNVEWQIGASARNEHPILAGHHFLRAAEAALEANEPAASQNYLLAAAGLMKACMWTLPHDAALEGATFFDDDAKRLLTWTDERAYVWDVSKAERLQVINPDAVIESASLSRRGDQILLWGGHSASLWDIGKETPVQTFEHQFIDGAMYHPNETQVITWADDDTICWDILSGKEQRRYDGSILPDTDFGQTPILTWHHNGFVDVWADDPHEPLRSYDYDFFGWHEQVLGARFNAKKTLILLWGDNGKVCCWNFDEQPEKLQTFSHEPNTAVNGAVFNTKHDSCILSWGNDHTVRLWSRQDGTQLLRLLHADSVSGAQFNDDESRILTWSEDGTARLWNATSGNPIKTFIHAGAVRGAKFAKNKPWVLTWSRDGTAKLWNVDAEDTQPLVTLRHETQLEMPLSYGLVGATFNPSETRVLTWADDGCVRLWDVTSKQPLHVLTHDEQNASYPGQVQQACWAPDQRHMLTQTSNNAWLWDLQGDIPVLVQFFEDEQAAFCRKGTSVLAWSRDARIVDWTDVGTETTFPHGAAWNFPIRAAFLTQNESRLLTIDRYGTSKLWNAKNGDRLNTFGQRPGKWDDPLFLSAAFDSHGMRVLIVMSDGDARLLNCDNGDQQRFRNSRNGAAFCRNATRVLTWEHGVNLWDVSSGTIVETFEHSKNVIAVQFNSDETRLLVTCADGTAKLWQVEPKKTLHVYRHDDAVIGATFSDDESRILTWSNDYSARLWSTTHDDPLAIYRTNGQVEGAAFNCDSTRVLTWGQDGTARLWDLRQNQPLVEFSHERRIRLATFDKEERRLVTCSEDATARIWDCQSPRNRSIESLIREHKIRTGTTIDSSGVLRVLEFEEWTKLR